MGNPEAKVVHGRANKPPIVGPTIVPTPHPAVMYPISLAWLVASQDSAMIVLTALQGPVL